MASLSNSINDFRKLVSVIIAFAPDQETLGRPFKIITHSHTFWTAIFGFANDFNSVISSFFSELSANAAASNAGIAFAKSFSASFFLIAIISFSLFSSISFKLAASCFDLTSMVDAVITFRSSSHAFVSASTTSFA